MSNTIKFLKSLMPPPEKTSQEFILSCFSDIKDFRSDVFLDFTHSNGMTYQAKAACVAFNTNVVRFYLRSEGSYLPASGRVVDCFFILIKNKQKIPCNFTSTVVASLQKDKSVYIDIAIPELMTHQQRRNNVRIPLKKIEIPNFRIWTGATVLDDENKRKSTWRPVEDEEFEMVDISASGLMLNITKESSLFPKIHKNVNILCTGNFATQKNQEQNYAIVANVCRLVDIEKSPSVSVGLHFDRWTKVADENSLWINVENNDGISFLGTWLAPFRTKLIKREK